MPTYDASKAECLVFTFKEGLLSPIAHDLRIAITRFEIVVDDARSSVVATFDTSSLVVDVPMKDGAENPSALSDADKSKIAGQIREDVLHSSKYPTATFRSTSLSARPDGGYDISGTLELHGKSQPLQAQSKLVGGKQQVDITLHQPDYGITPYKAMLGTLKIQSDVKVRVSV